MPRMIRINDRTDMSEYLGPAGVVAGTLKGFESRVEQVEMASGVQKAFSSKKHLAVEAGTGVGKSFAYLVPAIDAVGRRAGKVVVSTFTITLQEQLINKDIPFLTECMPQPFTAVLAKGRSNYICYRRLNFAFRNRSLVMGSYSEELDAIRDWSLGTKDGSLSDLTFSPHQTVWEAVCSEHGNCQGRTCGHFRDCWYQKARRGMEKADIIIANHALFFSDLSLRDHGANLLPDYDLAIIDEAHNIERVAEDHFGIDISGYKFKMLFDQLYNPRTHKGLLAYKKSDTAIDAVVDCIDASRRFFREVEGWHQSEGSRTGGRCEKNFVEDCMTGQLNRLRVELSKLVTETDDKDVDEKFELTKFVNRTATIAGELQCFLAQAKDDQVYWIEKSGSAKAKYRLKSAPLNVGPDIRRCLFDKLDSVVMTSATLSCDGKGEKQGFEFFASRVGLDNFDALKLGSPYDYQKQVTLYVEADMPDPNDAQFAAAAEETIKRYLLQTKGRAFVLFTSYSMLAKMSERLEDWMRENDIELLAQGGGEDRGALLAKFKDDKGSALFGTDSFWQGVDVPGEALSNVIITRLPFAVPDHPLLAGRIEQIRQQGGNPFFDYQLPGAIIKFKQGFGRLVRSKTDTGIVVVLDSRILSKAYGKRFLEAIPKCNTIVVRIK